jgi:hypothetical protein
MMNPSPQKAGFGRFVDGFPAGMALLIFAVQPLFASTEIPADRSSDTVTNIALANDDSRIDWIANDGSGAVSSTLQRNGANPSRKDDDTVSCLLKEGDSTFVIALPKRTLLDRLTFVNENADAQGDLRIAVSNYRLPAESSKWNTVDGSVHFAHKRLFNFSMLGVEAKYVRLSFHVENAGHIPALKVRSTEPLETLALQDRHVLRLPNPVASSGGNDGLTFGLTDLEARSRILYISSGPSKFSTCMVDGNPKSAFRFSPTDPYPTVVVELTAEERSHRVTVLYKMGGGHLDAFLLHEYSPPPGEGKDFGSTDSIDLQGLKPVATTRERANNGKAAMAFDPQGANFVALRWTPDSSGSRDEAFEVAEIGVSDGTTLAMIDPAERASVTNFGRGEAPGEVPIPPAPSE